MILTFLGIGAALVLCTLIFAGAVCWLTHEEETMKGEENHPQERPLLKVTVVKQEVGNDNEDGNKGNR